MNPGPLFITNTLTRRKEEFTPLRPPHVGLYVCGPTVYSDVHLGNVRSFLTFDVLYRWLRQLGYTVRYVRNIPDVGHLVDDVDHGEDKIAKRARLEQLEPMEIVQKYTNGFHDVMRLFNILPPSIEPTATGHLIEQIEMVKRIVASGYGYEANGSVYFDVPKFAEQHAYGELSGRKIDELLANTRDTEGMDEKRSPLDFAIWKKAEPQHLMKWPSPWGVGFPGWHLECSVMAMAYLGDTLDLHAGGEDLIFPHHECEIAQSEALTGKPFSRQWIHTRFLQVDGQKMSKSLGNFFTARDLVDGKGADPLAVRYALISQNYGVPHNFTMDLLRDASQKVERYRQCAEKAQKFLAAPADEVEGADVFVASLDTLYGETLDAMCDNLNTSVALAKSLEGTRVILRENALTKEMAEASIGFLDKINALLGIIHHEEEVVASQPSGPAIDPEWVNAKIVERAEAKKAKDFARADAIRAEVEAAGVELRDTPEGTTWKEKGPSL